jgi:hypothetical protein
MVSGVTPGVTTGGRLLLRRKRALHSAGIRPFWAAEAHRLLMDKMPTGASVDVAKACNRLQKVSVLTKGAIGIHSREQSNCED